jgi:energy-coupling factor transporter ATP-binding protein EcfA2
MSARRIKVKQIIKRTMAEHGGTILMVSHDCYLTGKLATRMVSLDQSRILEKP